VTKRSIRFTTAITVFFLIFNVIFLGAITSFYFEYNARINRYNSIISQYTPIYDDYGGLANSPTEWGEFEAKGFFTIQKLSGKYWFVTPLGNPFLSKGVNHVDPRNDYYLQNILEKYGTRERWAEATIDLLVKNGFNTITSWSAPEVMNNTLPYTILLDLGVRFANKLADKYHSVADYFDARFETLIDEVLETLVVPRQNDTLLLGIFTDNELIWGPDWRTPLTLLQIYLDFRITAPGRLIAIEFLKNQSKTVDNFNAAWKTNIKSLDEIGSLPISTFAAKTNEAKKITTDFDGKVAEQYGRLTAQKIRAAAPNHLILGCRFAGNPGDIIMENTAQFTDVFSYAGYNFDYTWDEWDAFVQKVDRPILVEEFSYRALDVGMPNIFYSGPVVINQYQRAIEFSKYVETLLSKPYGVGYHWFEFCDNPKYTFFHGENYGIVNIEDEPYEVLLKMALNLNGALEYIH
jgi:hypothetical protein